MGANQKYSTRVHSRRQLGRACEHIQEATKVLREVGERYADALPTISQGCAETISLLGMIGSLVEDMRTNI